MKNRKIVIVSFLVVAALLLGIGFAALTDDLDIFGTAKVDQLAADSEFETDVYFIKAGETTQTGYSATISEGNNDSATFTVTGLSGGGDTITIPFTIKNANDIGAYVTVNATSNTNEEYYELSHDLTSAKSISANGELVVNVTVRLKSTPTVEQSASFSIEVIASSDAPVSNT